MIENNNEEEEPFEPDSEFILRLPPYPAASLRAAIRTESKHWKNKLKVEIQDDMRHANVRFDKWNLRAKIYDLPSIIESHKTLDRKVFYKVADICQIMICNEEDCDESSEEEQGPKKLDKDGREKRYLYAHGISPCMKNVRKKRFRKTLRKKYTEMPSVEKEVKILLKTDSEAIHSRFEIVNVEDDKSLERSDSKQEDQLNGGDNDSQRAELGEYELFGGEVSSSSDDSEGEITASDLGEVPRNNSVLYEIKEESEAEETYNNSDDCVLISQHESEIAGRNLGHILQEGNATEDSNAYTEVNELHQELASLRAERELLEKRVMSTGDMATRQELQAHINQLKAEETHIETECNNFMMLLDRS